MALFTDGYGSLKEGWIFTLVVLGVLFGIGVLMVGLNAVDKHYTRKSCSAFAQQTDRKTKFVEYTYWNYECLAKTTDGKWLPKDNLREVVD